MKPFFQVKTLGEVHDLAAGIAPLPAEAVAFAAAAGRTLASDLLAPHDLPGFRRATMDGYAVHSRSTFGASESAPGYLTLAGEVAMGSAPGFQVGPGQCGRIGTGGMLPEGADAVVMVEYTRVVEEEMIEVARAVAPGQNVMQPTDDAAAGDVLLPAGHRLRPQDVGLLAALGVTEVEAVRRPKVGIISSGDEVVSVDQVPGPGRVRDVNTYTLSCLLESAGAAPVVIGLVPDDVEALRGAVEQSMAECDLTLLSGGSSVGSRDLTAEVFTSFPGAELLVHGVSVAPGKPLVWVRAGEKQLLGLPGPVASCMIAFHLFVEPILERLFGRPAAPFGRFARQDATLSRNVSAKPGREAFTRVRVYEQDGRRVAEPLFGKSGLLRTLTQGQGLVRIPLGHEGLDAGDTVTVLLFP